MGIAYTPDGYSYDNDNSWDYLRNVTWQNLGAANDFMVSIGERGPAGEILPFIQRFEGALKWGARIGGMIAGVGPFLADNPLVSNGLKRLYSGYKDNPDVKKISRIMTDTVKDLGVSDTLNILKVPVFVDPSEFVPIRQQWDSLDARHKIYVLKQFYKRIASNHGSLLSGDFSDQGLVNSIMVMSKLIPDNPGNMHPGVFLHSPKGREFWLGEGFGRHMNHVLGSSQNGGNPDSQSHAKKWNEAAKVIGLIDFNATKQEADNFLAQPVTQEPGNGNFVAGVGIAAAIIQFLS